MHSWLLSGQIDEPFYLDNQEVRGLDGAIALFVSKGKFFLDWKDSLLLLNLIDKRWDLRPKELMNPEELGLYRALVKTIKAPATRNRDKYLGQLIKEIAPNTKIKPARILRGADISIQSILFEVFKKALLQNQLEDARGALRLLGDETLRDFIAIHCLPYFFKQIPSQSKTYAFLVGGEFLDYAKETLGTCCYDDLELVFGYEREIINIELLAWAGAETGDTYRAFQLVNQYLDGFLEAGYHTLSLRDCDLHSLPEKIFRYDPFYLLDELDLGHNFLSSIPDSVTELPSLDTLDLSHNAFDHLPSSLPRNIVHLFASFNQIQEFPSAVTRLLRLRTLDLSLNEISTVPMELGRLNELETLSMSDNRITQFPFSILSLPSLKNLNLAGNEPEFVPSDPDSHAVDR